MPSDARPRLVRLDDPALLANPTPYWDHLLTTYPRGLAPVEVEAGVPAWLMLTWPIHHEVLSNPDLFTRNINYWRDHRNGVLPQDSPLRAMYAHRHNALSVDGVEHRHYRTVLAEAFAQMDRTHVMGQVWDIADRVIDTFCNDGQVDLVGQYASVLPLIALCRMLGMSDSDGIVMCTAMARVWRGDDGTRSHAQVESLMDRLVQDRRAAPAADLASELINGGLTDRQVRDHLTLIIAAGHAPVSQLITASLGMVLSDRNARLSMGSTWLVGQTINRSLWEHPPLPHVVGRYATANTTLGGYPIRAGDCLVLGFGAAQRHMLTGDHPADTADNRSHLVFGAGPHRCPERARDLATLLTEVAVQRIEHRLPDLALSNDPTAMSASPTLSAGLASLPAAFSPTAPRFEGAPWNLSPQSPSTPPTSTTTTPQQRSTRLVRWLTSIFGD